MSKPIRSAQSETKHKMSLKSLPILSHEAINLLVGRSTFVKLFFKLLYYPFHGLNKKNLVAHIEGGTQAGGGFSRGGC